MPRGAGSRERGAARQENLLPAPRSLNVVSSPPCPQLGEQAGDVEREGRDRRIGVPLEYRVVRGGCRASREPALDALVLRVYDPVLAPVCEVNRALLVAVVAPGRWGQHFNRQGRSPELFPGAEAAGGGTETDGNVGLEHRAGPVEHVEARPDLPQVMGVDVG